MTTAHKISHGLRQWRNAHEQAQRQAPEHVAAWTLLDLLPPGGRGDRSFDGA